MAEGTGPHIALPERDDHDAPATPEMALRQLDVLAHLPTQMVQVENERQLRAVLATAMIELFAPMARFELFVVDGPDGQLVPAGDAREGLALLGHVAASGEPLQDRATLLAGRASVHGDLLVAPMMDRQGTMGMLVVEATQERRFRGADLDALIAVAAQIALALQRLTLEQRTAAHRRLERDLVMAREVQRRFLPEELPAAFGLRVAAHYRPAYDVGGDFYDLIAHEDGSVTAVIGDVSGKGVSAALIMSRLTSDLRRLAPASATPRVLLEALHAHVQKDAPGETFVTAACLRIDVSNRRLVVANAGHVAPLLRRASGQVMPFGKPSGPPLGITHETGEGAWHDEELDLVPGDQILLMTDGLAEALDRPGDRLGARFVLGIVADAPRDLAQVQQRVLAAVERERVLRQVDDVTLLGLEVVR